jgi:hypothetical protein
VCSHICFTVLGYEDARTIKPQEKVYVGGEEGELRCLFYYVGNNDHFVAQGQVIVEGKRVWVKYDDVKNGGRAVVCENGLFDAEWNEGKRFGMLYAMCELGGSKKVNIEETRRTHRSQGVSAVAFKDKASGRVERDSMRKNKDRVRRQSEHEEEKKKTDEEAVDLTMGGLNDKPLAPRVSKKQRLGDRSEEEEIEEKMEEENEWARKLRKARVECVLTVKEKEQVAGQLAIYTSAYAKTLLPEDVWCWEYALIKEAYTKQRKERKEAKESFAKEVKKRSRKRVVESRDAEGRRRRRTVTDMAPMDLSD